jgi:8-oxo-dGTP diphosphatase
MMFDKFTFCPKCGKKLVEQIQFGQARETCPNCGYIHFEDPKVAIAALIMRDNEVLLARRINEPGKGLWTLPAGFMDAGENPEEAARRECLEETGLDVKISSLFTLINGREHPRGSDILLVYKAQIQSGELQPGDDVDELAFFPIENLPPLAFSSTRRILKNIA